MEWAGPRAGPAGREGGPQDSGEGEEAALQEARLP